MSNKIKGDEIKKKFYVRKSFGQNPNNINICWYI